MKNKKKQPANNDRTPIIDGDTRPDKNIEPAIDTESENRTPDKNTEKVTSNRQGDINSLEDYKDAK
jgi:hypothetical protein